MFGEFPILDPPNINSPVCKGLSGRRDPSKRMCMGGRMGGARNDLVAGDNALVNFHLVVRRCGEDPFEYLDSRGEAR